MCGKLVDFSKESTCCKNRRIVLFLKSTISYSIIATAGNSIVMSGARFIQIQMTETSVLSRFVNQVLFLRAMTLEDELSKGYYVVKKATATFESCDALPLKEIHSLYKH